MPVRILPLLIFLFIAACGIADSSEPMSLPIPSAPDAPAFAPPAVACTPTPCNIGDGEVDHCPGNCLGGCGTQCARLTPGYATAVPSPSTVPTTAPGSGFAIYFIDVGQGDATLIVSSTGETLLVDGGRSKDRILDRLERLGIDDLDAIAMTHPDADHIAGLVEVLEMYPIEQVYLNGGQSDSQTFGDLLAGIAEERADVVTVTRGDFIALGDLAIEVLHPGPLSGDSNEDSIVMLVSCGLVDVLLTGDAETPSEDSMLAAGIIREVEVLKVGHHGSRTSTSQQFLDVVSPEVGVISAGEENQYGHPHIEVVDRLASAGVKILLTDTSATDDTLVFETDCQRYQFTDGNGVISRTPSPSEPGAPSPPVQSGPPDSPLVEMGVGTRSGEALRFDPFGSDRNCGDFTSWAEAQDFYEAAGGPGVDRHRLDADMNGIACESLAGAP